MEYSQASIYTGEHNAIPDLNFDLYAEQLSKIAIKATAKSREAFTVGIFGSWGSGKTTLMRCIQEKLKTTTEAQCKTIWINPWKYDHKEDIKNALIQTILAEMADDPKFKDDKAKGNLKEIGRKVYQAMGVATRHIIKAKTGIDTEKFGRDITTEAISEGDEDTFNLYRFINTFETKFKELVNHYVGDNGRLAIFIDDLDRCLPENALTVLESLKLYLAQTNCIFFIGLDKRVIEQAVTQRYRDVSITGKEYIEKIIRLNFFLPDKDPEEVKKLFLNSSMITGKYDEENSKELWQMILDGTRGNLRKVEQFIIAFELIEEIVNGLNNKRKSAKSIDWDEHYPKLAKILLIQMNFPNFYDALEKDHDLMDKIKIQAGSTLDEDDQLKSVKEKFPFIDDQALVDFIIKHFDYGKITKKDWKIIHKLSEAVIGD